MASGWCGRWLSWDCRWPSVVPPGLGVLSRWLKRRTPTHPHKEQSPRKPTKTFSEAWHRASVHNLASNKIKMEYFTRRKRKRKKIIYVNVNRDRYLDLWLRTDPSISHLCRSECRRRRQASHLRGARRTCSIPSARTARCRPP